MNNPAYLKKQQLEELERNLSDRDRCILESLQRCRYLTTLQIARLHCDHSVSHRAAARTANRTLAKLCDYGLIRALARRIGGVRAGSGSCVWTLTSAGFRLLHLRSGDSNARKQFREPTLHFLTHTLVISEAYLQLTEICARHELNLDHVQFEPDCWRKYGAKQAILKPDLYAVTEGRGYRDHYFIEIDCDTETVARVVDKCERYIQYGRSGAEQKQIGVFPHVVWIVPDEKRKNSVVKHLRTQFPRGPDLFIVILPDELEALVVKGAAEYMKQKVKQ